MTTEEADTILDAVTSVQLILTAAVEDLLSEQHETVSHLEHSWSIIKDALPEGVFLEER